MTIPIRLGRGLNDREHWRARHRRVKAEKEAVLWMLRGQPAPSAPLVVTMTRVSPATRPMDDDGVTSSLKACRDAVAHWLGIDDGDKRVRYVCAQARGPWAVRIDIKPATAESETR